MTLPVELEIRFDGGRTERVKLPVEMWNLGPHFRYRVRSAQRITGVEIDPRRVLPDVDRGNNAFPR
jgi:hypothetical protein